jgi:ABC-type nitrate/sulfonate/bicarbonate transport system substrate-binding protein
MTRTIGHVSVTRSASAALRGGGWALCLLAAISCARAPAAKRQPGELEARVLHYEGSTNNVSYPELAEDLGYLAPLRLEYIGNNATGGPHSIQSVVTGDVDFGSAFNGAIIKLIAAKAPLRAVLASYGTDENTFSGYYTLADSPIRSARDLLGKKVSMNTLGAHAEFALKEYLSRAGLGSEQAKQVTMLVLPPVNGELALRNKQVELAAFGTILRDKAVERGGIRMLFSDYQLFGKFNAGSYVMSNKFIATCPNTVRKFVQATGRAIEWARTNPREQVIARFAQIIHRRKRNEDTSALQYWRSTGIASERGLIAERDYQMWIDWLVKDGQLQPGQLKARDLFTNEFQTGGNQLATLAH